MKFDFNRSRFDFIESYKKDYDPFLLIDIYDSVAEFYNEKISEKFDEGYSEGHKFGYTHGFNEGYQEGLRDTNPVEVEQEEEYDFDDDQDLTLLSYSQLYHYRHQRLKNKLDFNNYDEIGKFAIAVQKEYNGYIKQYLLKIGMI